MKSAEPPESDSRHTAARGGLSDLARWPLLRRPKNRALDMSLRLPSTDPHGGFCTAPRCFTQVSPTCVGVSDRRGQMRAAELRRCAPPLAVAQQETAE